MDGRKSNFSLGINVAEKTLDVYNGLTIARLKKQLEERERIYELNTKDLHHKKK